MAVAEPRNLKEAALVERRLREKYPQMFTERYKQRVEKEKKRKAKRKPKKTRRTKKVSGGLAKAGLTAAEIKKLQRK